MSRVNYTYDNLTIGTVVRVDFYGVIFEAEIYTLYYRDDDYGDPCLLYMYGCLVPRNLRHIMSKPAHEIAFYYRRYGSCWRFGPPELYKRAQHDFMEIVPSEIIQVLDLKW